MKVKSDDTELPPVAIARCRKKTLPPQVITTKSYRDSAILLALTP